MLTATSLIYWPWPTLCKVVVFVVLSVVPNTQSNWFLINRFSLDLSFCCFYNQIQIQIRSISQKMHTFFYHGRPGITVIFKHTVYKYHQGKIRVNSIGLTIVSIVTLIYFVIAKFT